MRTRFMSIVAGGAVAATLALGSAGTASAGGINGTLCTVKYPGSVIYLYSEPGYAATTIYGGQTFRRHEAHGGGWSFGHAEATFPTDYWIHTSDLNC